MCLCFQVAFSAAHVIRAVRQEVVVFLNHDIIRSIGQSECARLA